MATQLTAVDKSVEAVDKLRSINALATIRSEMKTALGIFAKQPVAGRVKTRLCPPLSAEEAAELYRCSLEETVAAISGTGFEPVLFFDGDGNYFKQAFSGVRLVPQGEGNLGARLERALKFLLDESCEAASVIGTDTPDLPVSLLVEAFAALRQADAVVAPARDGGYVLIGERRHIPELFRDIPWSTGQVLTATRRRAAEAAVDLREVGGWEDVDDIESLRRLLERSPTSTTAQHAVSLLARYGFSECCDPCP